MRPALRMLLSASMAFALAAMMSAERTQSTLPQAGAPAKVDAVATEEEVKTRCGTVCHQFPPPDILPRSAWRDEMVRMMLIQEGVPEPAGATSFIPLPPDWLRLLRYYEAHAPERLPDPEPWPAPATEPLAFSKRLLVPSDLSGAAAVAHVRFLDLDGDKKLDIVASEMRSGAMYAGLSRKAFALEPIAKLRHPSHIEQVDLDKDGLQDLLVADLGSFQPADHTDGAVYWLRQTESRDRSGAVSVAFKPIALAEGLARVADARAADFDKDGDLDVILAIFGWRRTGNVTLLENRTTSWSAPQFVAKVLDPRTGAIHVPVVDIDKDGRLDFVALLAQEHESIVAFRNTARGLEFAPQTIYAAPHPNWGSSGLEMIDLDQDGDLDALLTHGDTFDDFVLKPYHGLQWLENQGTFPWTVHTLARLPGAQRAQAADLDGDGDLDIVASAMIAGGEVGPQLASVVWLEQIKPGTFERRTIEKGTPFHASLDLADHDADGDIDIVVGWFSLGKPLESWIDLWDNKRK